jgi:hypothetical protein
MSLVTELLDYVEHMSWRCAHRSRFPWPERDCHCGLVALLNDAGLSLHHADVADPDEAHARSMAREKPV